MIASGPISPKRESSVSKKTTMIASSLVAPIVSCRRHAFGMNRRHASARTPYQARRESAALEKLEA
jgi:hypothetical protein